MIGGADTRTYFLTLNPAPDLLEYTQASNIVEAPRELRHYTKAYLPSVTEKHIENRQHPFVTRPALVPTRQCIL